MAGKIYRYLADDHTRLEELLERILVSVPSWREGREDYGPPRL